MSIKIEQTGSPIRRHHRQRATLIGLGLGRIGRTANVPDTPQTRGMIARVKHLIRVHPKRCIVTKEVLTPANDSRAHVIPSALGGRLKPKGILSGVGNKELNDRIDLPLIKAFQPLMTMLNASRDRGTNPFVRMTDENGRAFDFNFAEPLRPTRPELHFEERPNGIYSVRLAARTRDEARTLLGQITARFPEFDVEEALQHAELAREYPAGMLHHRLQFGPIVTFPGAFAAANIFSAFCSFCVHPQFSAYVRNLHDEEPGRILPPDTFYFYSRAQWFNTTATNDSITHVLALIGDPRRRRMLVYVDYFNLVCAGVLLPFDGSHQVQKTYAVDILAGREVQMTIDEDAIAKLQWEPSHVLGQAELYAETTRRLNRIMRLSVQRQRQQAVDAFVSDMLGGNAQSSADDQWGRIVEFAGMIAAGMVRRPE